MHQKLLLTLALALSTPAFATTSTTSKLVTTPVNPFTSERNTAIGSLTTTIVMLQKMAGVCSTDSNKEKISNSIKDWQERNRPYLVMHTSYIQGMIASLKKAEGEEEAKKLFNTISKFSNDEANTAIKKVIDQDGKDVACTKYFSFVSAGQLDIKKDFPHYKTLKEMLDFSNGKKSEPKAKNK